MNLKEIEQTLKQRLSPKRFAHILGVSQTAQQLAKRYGSDEQQALIAGLLHDCAREISNDRLLQLARSFGIVVNAADPAEMAVLHAKVGAQLANHEFGIHDETICDAIACHTSGKVGMNLLDKIIYLADCIEPSRHYEGIEKLREIASKDLNQAVLKAIDRSIVYLIEKKAPIYYETIEARNDLLRQKL